MRVIATILVLMMLSAGAVRAQDAAGGPWQVQDYRFSAATAAPAGIDLGSGGTTEEITVYARRHLKAEAPGAAAPLAAGPVTITGRDDSRMAGFSGMTVTAGLPIRAVPGLQAVLNLSAGHDTANPASSPAAAAVTAGIKLAF